MKEICNCLITFLMFREIQVLCFRLTIVGQFAISRLDACSMTNNQNNKPSSTAEGSWAGVAVSEGVSKLVSLEGYLYYNCYYWKTI